MGVVLVVDDDPAVVRVARRMLAEIVEVLTAGGVEEAIRVLSSHDVDAVLTDVMMPGKTGIDLYEWIVAERPSLEPRVVFMTAGAYSESARSALAALRARHLEKPLEKDRLLLSIRRLLSR